MAKAEFLTLAQSGQVEWIEKKSRFIGQAAPVETEAQAQAFLQEIRARHHEATHHVYAYQIGPLDEIQRSNDDGEPAGTAGRPVLEAIKKAGVKNVIVVVTRYFGGILLGAGGLTRAYSKTASLVLNACGFARQIPARRLLLTFDYSLVDRVENWLGQHAYVADQKSYGEKIAFSCLVPLPDIDRVEKELAELSGGSLRLDDLGEERNICQKI